MSYFRNVKIVDLDSGAGTDLVALTGLARPGAGGAQIIGGTDAPIIVDLGGNASTNVDLINTNAAAIASLQADVKILAQEIKALVQDIKTLLQGAATIPVTYTAVGNGSIIPPFNGLALKAIGGSVTVTTGPVANRRSYTLASGKTLAFGIGENDYFDVSVDWVLGSGASLDISLTYRA